MFMCEDALQNTAVKLQDRSLSPEFLNQKLIFAKIIYYCAIFTLL